MPRRRRPRRRTTGRPASALSALPEATIASRIAVLKGSRVIIASASTLVSALRGTTSNCPVRRAVSMTVGPRGGGQGALREARSASGSESTSAGRRSLPRRCGFRRASDSSGGIARAVIRRDTVALSHRATGPTGSATHDSDIGGGQDRGGAEAGRRTGRATPTMSDQTTTNRRIFQTRHLLTSTFLVRSSRASRTTSTLMGWVGEPADDGPTPAFPRIRARGSW